MKALWAGLSGLSIATKQFVFLFFVALLLFLTLAYVNLRDAERLYRHQVVRDAESLMTRTADLIDAYLDNANNVLVMLSQSQELFEEGNEDKAIRTMRNYAVSNNSAIDALYLIRSDGKVLTNNQVFYEIMGHPRLEHLLEVANNNYRAVNVSEPYHSPYAGYTVAYTKPVFDGSNAFVGTAVVEINLNMMIGRIAPLLIGPHQTFVMVTKSGETVDTQNAKSELLPYVPSVYPPRLDDRFQQRVGQLPVGIHSLQGAVEPLVAVKSNYNRMGWSIVLFIEESHFFHAVQMLHTNFRSAGIVWLIALIFCTFMLSRYFTSPIRALAQKMEHAQNFKPVLLPSTKRRDEIGKLVSSYNAMTQRNHLLIEEVKAIELHKKELEMKMLQSQIAPHFLYNTLACISSLAKQRMTAEVVQTVKSLVGLLSFSFDRTQSTVKLKDELEVLRMYVQIQQVRYGDKISLTERIDPEALEAPILKLTLQPIVENAIFHGLAPRKAPGTVRVTANMRRGKLLIFVRDDGNGMPPALARRLLQDDPAPAAGKFTSIGLKNVNERIRLYHGNRYGLRIRSIPGVGTVVRIVIPGLA